MKVSRAIFATVTLAALASCHRDEPTGGHAPGIAARRGVVAVGTVAADRVVAGQTIYVPAYSSIYTSDRAHHFNLAVTLSLRNTDRAHPIVVTALKYHDQDGRLIHDGLKTPLQVAPLAALDYFIPESDTSGGVAASFLVEWVAEHRVTSPVAEAVMIGASGQQGISFTSAGRVLVERGPPEPSEPGRRD